MTHDTPACFPRRKQEGRDRNIYLSLRAGTNMRRRDEEAAGDVGRAMRINGWNVVPPVLPHVAPKSIAFRSARSRYYCYDRLGSLRNVGRREIHGTRASLLRIHPDSNFPDCLHGDGGRSDEKARYRRERSPPRTCRPVVNLPATSPINPPERSAWKLVENGTDGKKNCSRPRSLRRRRSFALFPSTAT